MKNYLVALSLLIGSAAAAEKTYDIKIDLSLNKKKISTSRLIVKEGEGGSVTQDTAAGKSFVEVVAMEGVAENKKAVMMNFIVGMINENGVRTIVSRPQILVAENELAEVIVGDQNNKEVMSMAVVARPAKTAP